MSRNWFERSKGQYNRMARWEHRVLDAIQDGNGNDIYVFIYAFFITCNHLSDWLIAEGVATRPEMNELFEDNTELRLCRDICNVHKHLQYNNKHKIDPAPRIGREWDPFKKEESGWYLYSDESKSIKEPKRRSIPELMRECIKSWDNYLISKGNPP